MRVIELIEHAVITSGMGRQGAVTNKLFDYALQELNRIYYHIYNVFPWDNIKIFNLEVTNTDGTVVLPQFVEYVRAVRIDNQPLVPVDEIRVSNWAPSTFDDTGDVVNFSYLSRSPVAAQPVAASLITIISTSAADTSALGKVRIEGTVGGVDDEEELALNGTSLVTGAKSFTNIREITKPKTTGRITIADTVPTTLGTIAPWDQQGHNKRIELLPNPDETVTVSLMCTRKFQNLVSDDDSIVIPEAESGILDMLIGALFGLQGDLQKQIKYQQQGLSNIEVGAFQEREINDKDHRSLPAEGLFGDLGTGVDDVHVRDTSITGIGL